MLRKTSAAPVLSIEPVPLDISRRKATKLASDLQLPSGVVPLPGSLLLSNRAISNRCNLNGDGFFKQELLGCFEGAPAHNSKYGYRSFTGDPVFLDHNNSFLDDPRGNILASIIHHDEMGKHASFRPHPAHTLVEDDDTWVQNFIEVDALRYPITATAAKLGFIKATSMGCDIEYSICSVCGSKATVTSDYCEHILGGKMAQVYQRDDSSLPEVVAYEDNRGLMFFEDTLLTVPPADPTADMLQVMVAKLGSDEQQMLKKVSEEQPLYESQGLWRMPGESIEVWAERRKELSKEAFRTTIAGLDLSKVASPPMGLVKNKGEDEDHVKDSDDDEPVPSDDKTKEEESSDDSDPDRPPRVPTAYADVPAPFSCPAIDIKINPTQCQGCKYNSEHGDLMACHYPEVVNEQGQDPERYLEDMPPSDNLFAKLRITSAVHGRYELLTNGTQVWVRRLKDGRVASYGRWDRKIKDPAKELRREVSSAHFTLRVVAAFNRLASRGAKKRRPVMARALSDKDREKVVLGQLNRMSPRAKARIARRLRRQADGVAEPTDMDDPFVNVVDKGMAPPLPAPQNVTPDDNDDGTGVVDVTQAPDVEDVGLQRPIGRRRGQQSGRKPRSRPAQAPQRQAPGRRAASRQAPAQRPVQARAPRGSSREQVMWAAADLADRQIQAGLAKKSEKMVVAKKIASEMSYDAILAAIQTHQQLSRQASARTTRRQADVRGARRGAMAQPSAQPSRVPARTASSQGSRDEALQALALG